VSDSLGFEDLGEEPAVPTTIEALEQDEIQAILGEEISTSIGCDGSEIAEQRAESLRYYRAEKFGNEQEGRSQVVLSDVRDTVEWIMPSLMRMFSGGQVTVRYEPTGPEPERQKAAEQATAYINHVFEKENNGFMVLYEWFKTALIEKCGFVRCYYDERVEPQIETLREVNDEELVMLMDGEEVELLEHSAYPDTTDPEGGELHDVTIKRVVRSGQIVVEGIPPEEFMIAERARTLDDRTPFCGIRKKMTISDLISLGFDPGEMEDLPDEDDPEWSMGALERRPEDGNVPGLESDRVDVASRELWVNDCIIRIDEDGDGYSELRRILCVGSSTVQILTDHYVNRNPFSVLCPSPMPFKFFGDCPADLVKDLQRIRSTLVRQMLDNLYLTNNTRLEVVEAAVEIDDLLNSRPGQIVRTTAPGMINPIVTSPFGPMAFSMLEFSETMKENRTGVTRYNQGLDASTLNQTATGIMRIMSASQAKIDLIGRVFAKTGILSLFKNMLREMIESPSKKRVVRLRGEWVPVDPASWDAEMDVTIEVGLGVGQATERLEHLQRLLDLQAQLVDKGFGDYLVTPENFWNLAKKLCEAMGFAIPELFFQDPEGKERPEQPPPVEVQVQQLRSQIDKMKLEVEGQQVSITAMKETGLQQFRMAELTANTQMEEKRIETDSTTRLQVAKIQADATKAKAAEKPAPKKE
jgi:hypothetical protein